MLNRASEVPGWMSSAELQWLQNEATRMSSVVELGSWKGRSTFALLTGCLGPVYAIDPLEGNPEWAVEPPWLEGESLGKDARPGRVYPKTEELVGDSVYAEFMRNVGHFWNLVSLRESSASAVHKIAAADMVFIDACHQYDAVRQDIDLWLPKTKKLICGHDFLDDENFSPSTQGVSKAVRERFKEYKRPAGHLWAVGLNGYVCG